MHRTLENPTDTGGVAAGVAAQQDTGQWWRDSVLYQVHLPTFADGDGFGDFTGARTRIGYLALLGVDAVCLSPVQATPQVDGGYTIAEHRLGDLAAFDALVGEVHREGLRVLVDLAPGYTTDTHPWFVDALAGPAGGATRARYHFADGRGPDGMTPPSDWSAATGGPAWTRVLGGQWYLHLAGPDHPDVNWENPDVAGELERTMRFFLDHGVDGFRVEVPRGIVQRSGPSRSNGTTVPHTDIAGHPLTGLTQPVTDAPAVHFDGEDGHQIHRMIRRILGSGSHVAIGALTPTEDGRLGDFVRPDELHEAFDGRLAAAGWDAAALTGAVNGILASMQTAGAPPAWVFVSQDPQRQVSRYGGGEQGQRRARAAALLQLALPGTAVIDAGDELGLPDVAQSADTVAFAVQDGPRVPLPWAGQRDPFEFTGGESAWLTAPDAWSESTVEAQLENTGSMLSLYRQALELRREHPAASGTGIDWYGAPPGCLALRRSGGLVCAVNTTDHPVPLPPGEPILSSVPLSGSSLPADAAVWLV